MSILRQAVKATCASLLPRKLMLSQGPQSRGLPARELAITCDDGPHPEHTPALLDLLKQHNIQATFFVIGEKAARHPEIIQRIVAEGHELGNHTWTHSEPCETSVNKFAEEVKRTQKLLNEHAPGTSRLMRPPKGELTMRKLLSLWKQQMTVALWNIDPRDYLMASTQTATGWGREYVVQGGDILLLHDDRPFAKHILQAVMEHEQNQEVSYVKVSTWLS